MVTVGGEVSVVPVALPVTTPETVPPFVVKLIFALTVEVVVGVKRTVTVWVAPNPPRVKGLPETILNGAGTDALPDTVPPPVFDTVKV